MRDRDAGLGRDRDALVAHRLAECIGARDQRDRRQIAGLEIGKDFLARHLVGVRRLEHPLADGLDDLNGAGQRNERNLGVFEHRDHRQGRAGGAAADHGNDLVFFDQTGGEGARVVGIAAVIVDDQLQLLAVHAAFRVDLINIDFQRLLFRIAEKRRRPGHRQDGADFDLRGCLVPGAEQGKKANSSGHGKALQCPHGTPRYDIYFAINTYQSGKTET